MKLLTAPKQLEKEFSCLLSQYSRVSFAVAWASVGFEGYDQLIAHRHKIARAVVGIHFYQTHPDFIAKFIDDERVRFVMQPDGVFHPKFYLFENSPSDWSCLLGSSNFTNAGFSSNSEANVVFGSREDEGGFIKAGLDAALDQYWNQSGTFDSGQFQHYESLWRSFRQKQRAMAGDFGQKRGEKNVLNTRLLNIPWDEFLQRVVNDKNHVVDDRIRVIRTARQLFEEKRHFMQMSKEERQGVAGFGREGDIHWGWFGSMAGAGTFSNRINENDP